MWTIPLVETQSITLNSVIVIAFQVCDYWQYFTNAFQIFGLNLHDNLYSTSVLQTSNFSRHGKCDICQESEIKIQSYGSTTEECSC